MARPRPRIDSATTAILVAAALAATLPVSASDPPPTPAEALALLKAGNARFVAGEMLDRDVAAEVRATAGGQTPHSIVLGCVDSRVPPEVIFDQGIGDIFSARIAGNFANTDIIGSMEFATEIAGSSLIVVLGHTSCGAVQGAVDGAQLDNLTHLLSNLGPAVYATSAAGGERTSKNTKLVNDVATTNVRMTVERIVRTSDVIERRIADGTLMIVGALYDIGTGAVTFLD